MSSGLVMIRFVGGPIESTSQSVGTIAVGTVPFCFLKGSACCKRSLLGKGLSKLILSATLGAETLCQGWLIRGEAFRGSRGASAVILPQESFKLCRSQQCKHLQGLVHPVADKGIYEQCWYVQVKYEDVKHTFHHGAQAALIRTC